MGQIPDISLCGVDGMSTSKRQEFMVWYDKEKDRDFDNRRVQEEYCQDDITVLREACTIFRREFIEIGNIEVFLEAFTTASVCKTFLTPYTIGLIPAGGYSCNQNYSKKALIWLLHMEQEDECKISHARNGREYSLPELPFYSVDAYCHETKTVYEFLGCNFHCITSRPFRDLSTPSGDTLSERYERTMNRIEQIAKAVYNVKIQWECEFDEEKIAENKPELLTHPIVQHKSSKNKRCPIRGSNRGYASSL